MNEEVEKYPNVSLKGKKNKQKGDTDSGHLRYGQNPTKQNKGN